MYSATVRAVYRIALVMYWVVSSGVKGLSSVAGATSVNIVGLPGGVTQSLPISYVYSFPRWMVTATATDNQILSHVCNSQRSQVEYSFGANLQILPTLDVLINPISWPDCKSEALLRRIKKCVH